MVLKKILNKKALSNPFKKINIVQVSVILLLILVCSNIFPPVINELSKVLDNVLMKILFLVLIIISFRENVFIGMLLAVLFVLCIQKNNIVDTFDILNQGKNIKENFKEQLDMANNDNIGGEDNALYEDNEVDVAEGYAPDEIDMVNGYDNEMQYGE
jgi:hypothetical protein